MINLEQLTKADFERMAQEINEISETQSEDSLLAIIGNALHDSGLTVSTSNSFQILQPKMYNEEIEKFSVIKSINFVSETAPLTPNDAVKEVRNFLERIRGVICNDPKIIMLFEGNGTLEDSIRNIIPIILTAVGVGLPNPILFAIAVAVLCIIIKVGYKTYCQIA